MHNVLHHGRDFYYTDNLREQGKWWMMVKPIVYKQDGIVRYGEVQNCILYLRKIDVSCVDYLQEKPEWATKSWEDPKKFLVAQKKPFWRRWKFW